jgi:hypothetical protein
MTAPSGYVLEPLRERADFTLYRGRQRGNASPVLAIALFAEQPSLQSLRRLEHEYSLAVELDPAWAIMPLVLTRQEGGQSSYSRIPAVSHWIGFSNGTKGKHLT